MRTFWRLMGALLFLLLASAVLFFVLENRQSVALMLFGWSAPALPVSVLVLVALVVGLFVGPILGMLVPSFMGRRRRPV